MAERQEGSPKEVRILSYLKRAETILFHMSEMHGDEVFVSEGYGYYEDCSKAMAHEMAKIRRETFEEALNAVFFVRCSGLIILKDPEYVKGFIDACKNISRDIRKLKEIEDSEKNSDAMDPMAVSRYTPQCTCMPKHPGKNVMCLVHGKGAKK